MKAAPLLTTTIFIASMEACLGVFAADVDTLRALQALSCAKEPTRRQTTSSDTNTDKAAVLSAAATVSSLECSTPGTQKESDCHDSC